MNVNVLVNLFDIHNEASLLAIEKLKPKHVIYIIDEEFLESYRKIHQYYVEHFKNIKFESYVIKTGEINDINKVLQSLYSDEVVINVTGGKRISSLILFNQAVRSRFNIIYIDILNKQWYTLGDHVSRSREEFRDIMLEDLISLSGSDIIMDSSELSKKEEIKKITKMIYEHLDIWYEYKSRLYDGKIFIHDKENEQIISINKNNLNVQEFNILRSSLIFLKDNNCITYKEYRTLIEVTFLKNYIKSFIFKSGTWLEVLTNIAINEIVEVDDAKSGLVFMWNEGNRRIRNELDVVAVKDSILICISCKDSEKYDEDALNELDVYSKRLGGNVAKKILVATKKPLKQCVSERAKAMGIELIILGKNLNEFKEKLRYIINKK